MGTVGGLRGGIDLKVEGGHKKMPKFVFYCIFMPLYPDFWAKCEIFALEGGSGALY